MLSLEIKSVRHETDIIIGDYPFADRVKEEVISLMSKGCRSISNEYSNVKATLHTEWNWETENITFTNLKSYILNEIEKYYAPGAVSGIDKDCKKSKLICNNFWANVYEKCDYAESHDHKPWNYSFAYFVKGKWYHSPFIFTKGGKRIRPKEGRFVAFPSYLKHHVPKHRFKESRITLSGNAYMDGLYRS